MVPGLDTLSPIFSYNFELLHGGTQRRTLSCYECEQKKLTLVLLLKTII